MLLLSAFVSVSCLALTLLIVWSTLSSAGNARRFWLLTLATVTFVTVIYVILELSGIGMGIVWVVVLVTYVATAVTILQLVRFAGFRIVADSPHATEPSETTGQNRSEQFF